MSGYIGVQPVPQATQRREYFTATSGQTTFNTNGYTPNYIDVYMNGVKLSPADFTASNGSDVVLASGAATGDLIQVVSFTPFNVANQTFIGDVNLSSGAYKIGGNTVINSSRAITATGLTVDGTLYANRTDAAAILTLQRSGSSVFQLSSDASFGSYLDNPNGDTYIRSTGVKSILLGTNGVSQRQKIDSNGDISFYEDTGTTAKFFWDASAETLDIGSYVGSSVNAPLNLKSDANHHGLSIEENSGTETWQLGINADGDLSFHNSGSPTPSVMFDDNGRVAIGGTTVTDVNMLNIQGSGATNNIGVAFNDTNTSKIYGIQNGGTSLKFFDYSASATRMMIDTNGTIGINATPNANWSSAFDGRIDVGGGGLVVGNEEAVHLGVNWYYDGTNYRYRNTGHASSMYHDQGETVFQRVPSGSAGSTFGWVESARLDTSGNLLVGGHTSAFSPIANGGSGVTATASGQLFAGHAGPPLYVNREDSDGDIAVFRKDGTKVGSIARASNAFQVIASAVSGTYNMLQLGATAQNQQTYYLQWDAHNGAFYSLNDNAHDLGTSSNRWQDLYLSGGVYLGGVGAANKLTDYEEGTWTPYFGGSGGNPTVTYSSQRGTYVKTGNMVIAHFKMNWTAWTVDGSGYTTILGLPFTSKSGSGWYTGSISETGNGLVWGSGYTQVSVEVVNGGTTMAVTKMGSQVDQAVFSPTVAVWSSNDYLNGVIMYPV